MVLDPSGTLAICTCADGSVAVYDLQLPELQQGASRGPDSSGSANPRPAAAGKLVARGGGHGEMSTAVIVLDGGKR